MLTRQVLIIGVAVVLIVVIVSGYLVWQSGYFNPTATPSPSVTPSPTPTPITTPTPTASATPEVSTQEQVRDAVMTYIKTNHNETATYMLSFSWTGGRTTPELILGAETYSYQSEGWNVTMQYPVVPNPIYAVTADYTSPISQVTPAEKIVAWLGTWQNGTISETSYNNTMLPIQEQVRNNVMAYIKNNHEETAQFMQSFNWTGGRVDTGLLGSVLYSYQSQAWNVTMRYPVVPNPIYTVSANYTAGTVAIFWQGAWQSGNINETSYTNNELTEQEQVRNDIVNYLRTNHADTVQYLQTYDWFEENLTPEGLVGASTYSYLNQGWNITMQYPVVLNPTYTITANYTSQATPPQTIIVWQGTWQNGTITETSYSYTP